MHISLHYKFHILYALPNPSDQLSGMHVTVHGSVAHRIYQKSGELEKGSQLASEGITFQLVANYSTCSALLHSRIEMIRYGRIVYHISVPGDPRIISH